MDAKRRLSKTTTEFYICLKNHLRAHLLGMGCIPYFRGQTPRPVFEKNVIKIVKFHFLCELETFVLLIHSQYQIQLDPFIRFLNTSMKAKINRVLPFRNYFVDELL